MNRLVLSSCIAALLAAGSAAEVRAEDKPAEKADEKPAATAVETAPKATSEVKPLNVITVNVPSNLFGAYSVEYQRVLDEKLSLVVEPTLFVPLFDGGIPVFGPGAVVGVAVHPLDATGHAPEGLFVIGEGYLTYLDSQLDDDGFALGGGVGAVAGWTFRWWDHFVLSLGLGGTANGFGYNLAGAPGFGFTPVIRLNVGGAF